MASTTVKVEGLRELGEAMRELQVDFAQKVARQAVGAAARVVKRRAVRNVVSSPAVRTGSLRDAVIVKAVPKWQTPYTAEAIVTVRGRGKARGKVDQKQNRAPHAHFVEFGTVNMPAEPFLRPALEVERTAATEAMASALRKRIDAVRPK